MYDTTVLTFETYQTHEHGYDKTHVVVRRMYELDTATELEGTVDNKAGYGSMDACHRQNHRFQGMLDAGRDTHYDPTMSGFCIHIVWQHYYGGETPDYCDPTYDNLGRSFGEIEEAMALLKKLGRRIEKARARARSTEDVKCSPHPVTNRTFANPEEFLRAVSRIKGSVQVRRDKTFETWIATKVKPIPAPDAEAA